MKRLLGLLALVVIALGGFSASAEAAQFTVTSVDDTPDASPLGGLCSDVTGACTLRAAVQQANASPDPDTIVLPPGLFDLYQYGPDEDAALTGDLDITTPVAIVGAGASLTIVRAATDRVFDVRPGGSLDVRALTITGGVLNGTTGTGGGAGVRSLGTLSADGIVITENTIVAPAVAAGGGVAIEGGHAVLRASTLSLNSAATGTGRAIAVTGGDAQLENLTVARNTGPGGNGGAIAALSATTMRGLTIVDNRGGGVTIAAGVPVTFEAVLAGRNGAFDCSAPSPADVTFSSGNAIMIDDPSGRCSETGDAVALLGQNAELALTPLQLNGGPVPTMLPIPGSPAIDAGGACAARLPRDARGGSRAQAFACDVGAVETGSLGNLAPSLSAGPAGATVGGPVVITAVVRNHGVDEIGSALVELSFTGGAIVAASSPGGLCTGGAPLTCPLGPLPAGQAVAVVVTLRAGVAGLLAATATVRHAGPDLDPEDDSARVELTVARAAGDHSKPRLLIVGRRMRVSKAGVVNIGIGCPASERRCSGTASLRVGRTAHAPRRFSLTGGSRVILLVQLTPAERRQVARGSRLHAAFHTATFDAAGNRALATATLTLTR